MTKKANSVSKYTLVICEKADAAKRIANALGEKVTTFNILNSPVHRVKRGSEEYIICSAVGHLYNLGTTREKRDVFPIFDLTWYPLNVLEKRKNYISNKIKAILTLSNNAGKFVNACDYDVEGSVIGHNILRYGCKAESSKVFRAKFSTLTKEEVSNAFDHLKVGVDFSLVRAGVTRHIIDYIWGINLSRVLLSALQHSTNNVRAISTGRVQGPTLKFIVDREIEIRSFVTKPYWTVKAFVNSSNGKFYAEYLKDKIDTQSEALLIKEENEGKEGVVDQLRKMTVQIVPPTPFNIGDLQKDAFRLFGFSPSLTLSIAERLYLNALISYPRTNSQKLPASINYFKIIKELGRQTEYQKEAAILMKTKLVPKEGEKYDPAHPSIYPTGEIPPIEIDGRQKKLYDLIVRRFFSVFGDNAFKERMQLSIKVGNKYFWKVSGGRNLYLGWLVFYEKYSEREERALPPLEVGDKVLIENVIVNEKFNKRPPRYNYGSLLEKMEEENLGTKSTRAEIIETLYKRGYIMGDSITPTNLGFQIIQILSRYSNKIISTELTRDLERKLEDIENGNDIFNEVLEDTFYFTLQAINDLMLNIEDVGQDLEQALRETFYEKSILGKCPQCKDGNLIIIRNKNNGKRFIGCTNYKNGCRASSPLPQSGVIQNTGKTCSTCGWPIIIVKGKRRPWKLCTNIKCNRKK
ncbi:MAG: DNA topoisomerase I [Nitrososphaeria archaeon]